MHLNPFTTSLKMPLDIPISLSLPAPPKKGKIENKNKNIVPGHKQCIYVGIGYR